MTSPDSPPEPKCACGAYSKPGLNDPKTYQPCCSYCYDYAVGDPRLTESMAREAYADDYADGDFA